MRKILIVKVLVLFLGTTLYSQGIDEVQKWAWGPAAGWINHLTSDSIKVYSTHLEGYAYSGNIGWIRFGNYTGGDKYTYQNNSALNYGVNNDGEGNLSGYAWSSVAGWIDFSPANEGVKIDTASGEFSGFAYSPNLGWISFSGLAEDASPYGVVTSWRAEHPLAIEQYQGITGSTENFAFSVYPNPQYAGPYFIDFSFMAEGELQFSLAIYNLFGQKVRETGTEQTTGNTLRSIPVAHIETACFSTGVYLAVLRIKELDSGVCKTAALKFVIY